MTAAADFAALRLCSAARRGDTATVRRLLDAGAPPCSVDMNGEAAVWLALIGGHTETAFVLCAAGARLDQGRPWLSGSLRTGGA